MSGPAFEFTGARGQRLSGVLEAPDGPARAYAVFAHCFTCTKNALAAARVSRALAAEGVGVMRFDFTGLGQSEGDFAESTFSGDVGDLVAAVKAMTEAEMTPSLLVGHSLGGAAVLAAAPDLPQITAVATIAAPFDVTHATGQFGAALQTILEKGEAIVDLGGRPFTVRRAFVDDLADQDQAGRIGRLRRALLVLHSPTDPVVGIDNASAIFLAARHPKSFVSLDGADHLLTKPQDAAYAAQVIAAWASRYLPAALGPVTPTAPHELVTVAETGAGRYQLRVEASGTWFLADEPVEVGGLGSGPSPFELVEAGLGACTAITLRMYANQKGLPLERVGVTVSHVRRPDQAPPDLFSRRIRLEGALDEAQKARLMEIAERCPVHRTLERGAVIETLAADAPPLTSDAEDHFNATRLAAAD